MPASPRKLPFAPIEVRIGADGLRDLARKVGVDPATITRWREGGVSVDRADDLACQFAGVPGCAVWGDEWWRLVVLPDLADMAGVPGLDEAVLDEWDIADLLDLADAREAATSGATVAA